LVNGAGYHALAVALTVGPSPNSRPFKNVSSRAQCGILTWIQDTPLLDVGPLKIGFLVFFLKISGRGVFSNIIYD